MRKFLLIKTPLNNKRTTDTINLNPRCLWFAILTYSMLSLLSNWFTVSTISLGWLILNAGLLIFPINFLLSNLITEVYGYKHARRAVWCGFFFNLLFIVYGQTVIDMPSPNYSIHNPLFDKLIINYLKLSITSIASYFTVEPFNLFFIAKSKIYTDGCGMKLRFVLTTSLSTIISVIIFNFIKPNDSTFVIKLLSILFFSIITITIISPIIVYLAKKLKKLEQIDIYDTNTNFNMFKLEINYATGNNKFHKYDMTLH